MKSKITTDKEKLQINRIDEVNGVETNTSSITVNKNEIILQMNKNHLHS